MTARCPRARRLRSSSIKRSSICSTSSSMSISCPAQVQAASMLAPKFQTAQQKLTGMQFHHFGAFYKRSWRANDWMWGRLDGAGWLIHVLLDPHRLHALATAAGDPDRFRAELRARLEQI